MKFVEKYLSKHHIIHAPHKWFLAFLISPIHFLEVKYQHNYHLKFVHARKLFLFDISLLLSIIVILGAIIFWWRYDPTVASLVSLKVTPTYNENRLSSGQRISYTASFENNSKTTLVNPSLKLSVPDGFIYQDANPQEIFDPEKMTFVLNNIEPRSHGSVDFGGFLYGIPHESQHINVELSYNQAERNVRESVYHRTITIFRDSYLQGELEMPTDIILSIPTKIKIRLKNTSPDLNLNIQNISLPLASNWSEIIVDKGEIKNNTWQITNISAGEQAELTGYLTLSSVPNSDIYTIQIVPYVTINNVQISQVELTHSFMVSKPQLSVTSQWKQNVDKSTPGEEPKLSLEIKNTGNIDLENLQIKTSVPNNLINSTRLANLNIGKFSQGNFIINSSHNAGLLNLRQGESVTVEMIWPISWSPSGGEDISLVLNQVVEGTVKNVSPPNNLYSSNVTSPAVKIGTRLSLNSEVLYYTEEGDQLGRGPLPPEVGKETKYWILNIIKNGTSKATNLQFQAILPDYVVWTDKSSVSQNGGLNYNPSNHTVSWSTNSISPNTSVGVYFEVSLTPATNQIGTSPILVNSVNLTGLDSYIGANINKNLGSLDISIPNDSIGKAKGVVVSK